MPAELRRYNGKGDLHFITFSCYRRLPLLKTARARDIFVRELRRVHDEMEFRLIGYVVMREHVRLLIGEPKQGTPSSALQKLKLRVSWKMRKRRKVGFVGQLRLPFQENGDLAPQAFWAA
jgi:putative transposase